ncbi:MAG: RluA family pseudouridine synthase [Patescibacteria group bacterium]|nr:RluA family pseudouridine synthase [Patescibacteria group bacterium]
MQIPILYEDNDYVAINKPSGLVVHADGRSDNYTLTDWILEKYPEIKDVGEPIVTTDGKIINRPGIVHRIDRETSGVLIIAKNKKAHQYLKEQFQNREVQKKYNAFVYGELKDEDGIISRPIGRSKNDFRLWSAQRGARGLMREAETYYTVLNKGDGFSYIEVLPKTGRTHQIRVHFKAIHYPVVCDRLYAPKRPCGLGFSRLALHASKISFTNIEGKKIVIEAPLPEDFSNAIANMKSL